MKGRAVRVGWLFALVIGILSIAYLCAGERPALATSSVDPCLYNRIIVREAKGNQQVVSTAGGYHPVFSPDGTQVAYNTIDGQIRLITGEGTDQVVTAGFNPDWLDASTLVFMRMETSGEAGLATYNLTTGIEASLLNYPDRSIYYPRVSPDGLRLVFTRTIPTGMPNAGDFELVTYSLATGTEGILLTGPISWPTWSPDGQQLAYVMINPSTGSYDIMRVNSTGDGITTLTTNGFHFSPRWSANGRIYFTEGQGRSEIMSVNTAGQDLQRHAFGRAPDEHAGRLVFSNTICPTEADIVCGSAQLGSIGLVDGAGTKGELVVTVNLNTGLNRLAFHTPADSPLQVQNWSPRDVFQSGPDWHNTTGGVYTSWYMLKDIYATSIRLEVPYELTSGELATETFTCSRATYHASGVVVDTQGRLVPNATVMVTSTLGLSQGLTQAISTADGSFRLQWLPTADYILTASKTGYTFDPLVVSISDETVYPADITGLVIRSTDDPEVTSPTPSTPTPITPTPGTPTPEPSITPPPAAAFVTKSASAALVHQNEVYSYTLTVNNIGEVAFSGVLTDTLPNDVQYVDNPGGDFDSGTRIASWRVANLQPGDVRSFVFLVRAVHNANQTPAIVPSVGVTPSGAQSSAPLIIANDRYGLRLDAGTYVAGKPVYVAFERPTLPTPQPCEEGNYFGCDPSKFYLALPTVRR